MATPVEVPKLGNTVEECLISRWMKRKGDPIAAGDVVAEIETDKATFEVTAPVDGILLETFFDEGVLAPVFTNLFVIGARGEAVDVFRPKNRSLTVERQVAAPINASVPIGAEDSIGATTVREWSAPSMSPRARRFADQHNFRPPEVQGSGPGGRILESDLRKLYQPPQPRAPGIRDRIARRMRESLATTAQYTLHASAEATGLLALRGRLKTSAAHSGITINDLVTLCVVDALLDVPSLNAEYIDGKIHEHADIHIGFACDTPRGLLVPVVRNAHTLAIDELAAQIKELSGQAVAGNISPDDLSGATFTISNLGGLGIESFTPLLNPPQVAILGVGALQIKPVRRHGEIAFIDAIGLSLTCDHQVIDGAPGARFLAVVKQKIETVELLCAL
ncbi:MAG TPA: dihydrolipoamide acetyltransferase family protein [Candidatus Acidoferrales bacterium]|nr:dihydrolipoamide acetyltransferase family protein [Candidatus Acidoferrales bacterium]